VNGFSHYLESSCRHNSCARNKVPSFISVLSVSAVRSGFQESILHRIRAFGDSIRVPVSSFDATAVVQEQCLDYFGSLSLYSWLSFGDQGNM
jgi:hypothetical protein